MNFKVNRELLTLKCLYFFELSVIASVFIYATPFMSEYGVTTAEMAIINVVANIFAFLSRPLFGYLADKHQKYKELLIILSLLCAVVYSLYLASPKHVAPRVYTLAQQYKLNISIEQNLLIIYTSHKFSNSCWPSNLSQCHFNDRSFPNLDFSPQQIYTSSANYVPMTMNISFTALSTSMWCKNVISSCNNSRSPFISESTNTGFTWSSTFWYLAIAKTAGFFVYSPLVSLTDAVTFVTLGSNNAHKFGFTRMFGTIGVLVFSVVMAGILQIVSLLTPSSWLQNYSQFAPCFIVGAILFLVIVVTAFLLKLQKPIKADSFMKSLDVLYRDWEIAVFFAFSIMGGFILQVFAEFFFLTLFQRHTSLPKYFPGLIVVVMTVSESLVFGFSRHLLKHNNYEIWISISFILWSLRWFIYIFIDNFWFHLLVELLHGPSFALMLSCMMAHIGKLATVNTQGRMQGMFSGIYFNIGGVFGGFVGGMLLDNFGMFGLYKVMSALSLVCGLYCPLQRWIIRRQCISSVKSEVCIKIDDIDDISNEKPLLTVDSAAQA